MTGDYRQTPLWNCGLTIEQRLDYLMRELTFEEKLQCLGTGCPEIERLGIPSFYVGGEGAHGVQARHDQSFDLGEPQPTTVFPNPIGMSSTWDTELLRDVGRAVGNEARVVFEKEGKGGLCLWAPTVDMERDPRWGRTEEAYGEDPFLAGRMAAAYVRGLRGDDPFYIRCGATLKHFYANNVEEGRVWKSSSIDPRNRFEYYLEPFRRAVVEGGAEGIMAAYNEVDGVPCLLSDEMQKIAKDAWGVHHFVCDGGDMQQTVEEHGYFASHTETVAAALKAGLDCFTDDIDIVMEGAREAYERGMITMDDIDRALRCHFGTMLRLGLMDALPKNPYSSIPDRELNSREHQKLARRVTAESVVLLQNRETENGKLLPLKRGQKFAVIGPWADIWLMDWYSGVPPYHVTPLEGILDGLAGDSMCDTSESDGRSEKAVCDIASEVMAESGIPHIQLCCGERYLGILDEDGTVGLVDKKHAEIFEVMLWDDRQLTLRAMSNGKLLFVEDGKDEQKNYRRGVVTATKEEAFGWFIKESFLAKWEGDSFYQALLGGEELFLRAWNGAELFVDEENRLRVCEDGGFVEEGELVPVEKGGNFIVHTRSGRQYERLSGFRAVVKKDSLRDAAEVAAAADVVLMLAGAHPMITCKEERDRKDIEFPLFQRELIQAVAEANPQMVLVLVSSVPYAIRWEQENIPAILTMATGSMELGNGLADVLLGNVPPAGRLNMTWYRDTNQLPAMDHYDIIQEERTYQYFQGDVLYPFGHGLTYAAFDYTDFHVKLCDLTSLLVSLNIENIGECTSDEVVQIYVTKKNSCVKRPLRQLKAFQRVHATTPGEIRHLEFVIPLEELRYFDVIEEQMLLELGEYEIQAGASSQDIRVRESIVLDGTPRGVRDALRRNPAEFYDRSLHACRTEGHMGYIGIASDALQKPRATLRKDMSESEGSADSVAQEDCAMVLEYERVCFSKAVKSFILDAYAEKGAEITVFLNNRQIGHYVEREDMAEETAFGGMKEDLARKRLHRDSRFKEITIALSEEEIASYLPEEDTLPKSGEERSCCRQHTDDVDPEKTGTLKLVCTGDVVLCRWWLS